MKQRILVIEDTDSIREEIATILTFEGFDVATAPNGRLGVERAQAEPPDLIVSDLLMPELDGHGVLRAIRADARTAATPRLFLTARASREDLRQGMELGADDYLTKPFSAPELVRAVRIQLSKRAALATRTEQSIHQRFISILPHEFRTPLTGILGFARILKEEGASLPDAEIRQMADQIVLCGERLERTLQNFLLYSRLSASPNPGPTANPFARTSCNVEAALTEPIHQKAESLGRRQDLSVQLASAWIDFPEADLVKIVDELLDNAFKFSKAGSTIRAIGRLAVDKYEIEIEDHGSGMTKEQVESIAAWQQFNRARLEQQGCGIGLFLVKRMTEMRGATFAIEGGPSGTTARLQLPLSSAPSRAAA